MIDLHMHSKYSDDGEYEPLDLVEKCFENGIRIMSVTDHNCVKANAEAEAAANKRGIWYIPGVEIDCAYLNMNFHVLGYGIDYRSEDFANIEKTISKQEFEASLKRLEQTQILGFRITENEMWEMSKNRYKKDCWTGEMFGEALLKKEEYKEHPLLKPYRPGGARSDNPYVNFYWDFYAQGKPCYVKMTYPAMVEVLDIIRANHGTAVLAHPGVNLKNHFDMTDEILELGFDGVEVFSSYHGLPEADFFYKKAQEKHLMMTCGSDYHGKTKPAVWLGQHHCRISFADMQKQLAKRLDPT